MFDDDLFLYHLEYKAKYI